jgi:Tol biopolymer transport system component
VTYSSVRTGQPSIWRVPIDGGEPAPIVQQQSLEALPSPTGRYLYYHGVEWDERPVRTRHLRWIVVAAAGGARVFGEDAPPGARLGVSPVWAPDESGLDYIVTRDGVSNIWRQPLNGGPPVALTHFVSGRIFSVAWSRDGRWLSLGSGVNRSDVVMIASGR